MKRLIYTALLTLGLSSAALAASGQDSAPPAAPQRLASAHGATGHDSAPLDKHQRAIIAHRAMNNSSAAAHQRIIQGHQRMHDAETQRRGK
ncbi:silver resistance protein [Edwardsiella anguillarum]|uniref:silver resistance protein n=1 Tax=Edwardsiella anguillarum TaxID=1821960 RepID=UPI0024B7A48A|nr:silver resistance protein [Edwardsiella anguillarum]WHP81878.1 silver resistance protein [Edwardsiella anguillarum]WHQ19380.1 silver resistance protein [Edwardsiella anguillarum]WHQ22926.1 silver resistance protein [Edwardsiella anguillarum]WHQ26450.1 silver resistance protein [Edwardsiella anguillarum]WHQ29963.1 silver resistance protein [Edwardsiella anguillarum]